MAKEFKIKPLDDNALSEVSGGAGNNPLAWKLLIVCGNCNHAFPHDEDELDLVKAYLASDQNVCPDCQAKGSLTWEMLP